MALKLSVNQADYDFHIELPVRMSDLAGGLHVANHIFIAYLTETQLQYMKALGFPMLTVDGSMPINGHLETTFLGEGKYGDVFDIGIKVSSHDEKRYYLDLLISNQYSQKPVCMGRMTMFFVDMEKGGTVPIPDSFLVAVEQHKKE